VLEPVLLFCGKRPALARTQAKAKKAHTAGCGLTLDNTYCSARGFPRKYILLELNPKYQMILK
jgi:hypothetical protein